MSFLNKYFYSNRYIIYPKMNETYNYNHLYYFYICAQLKSISKAAAYLRTTQPSLSIQIKTLEEKHGVKLFNRNGRSIELTHDGKIIFSFCEKMFSETKHITNFIKNKSLYERESISIGVSEQIERPYIADILGGLITQTREEFPKIRMQTLPSNEMLSMLKMDTIDLVITHDKVSVKNIDFLTLDVPVALAGKRALLDNCSNDRNKIKIFLKNFNGGLIAPIETFKLRIETDIYFSKTSFPPEIVFESSNMSANIRAISEGVGIGFLPLIYISKEIQNKNLTYFMPENGLWTHSIYIYYSKTSINKKSIQNLLKLFQESVQTEKR